jgi:phage head maturation protease
MAFQKKEILNNTNDKGFFKAFIPLTVKNGKVEIIEKSMGDGKMCKYLSGVASNTMVDKEDDRMSKAFIAKMKNQMMGLNVFSEHEHSIDKTVGFIDAVSGDDDNVVVDTALESEEDNEIVKSVLKKIAHGTKIGYSIGGRITKAVKSWDESLKKTVNEIMDGEIYEVSLTALPAGNGTWCMPIQKSLKEMLKAMNEDKPFTIEKTVKIETAEELTKTLTEMVESDSVNNEIYDLFWAFRSAVHSITFNDDLTPEDKSTKIMAVSAEFAAKIEELSGKLAALMETISENLTGSEAA